MRNNWNDNDWEFLQNKVRQQTTASGISEIVKQDKWQKKLHIGISYLNFSTSKNKEKSWKKLGAKNTLFIEEQR